MREELERIESMGENADLQELTGWLAHEDWQVRRAAVEAVVSRTVGLDLANRASVVERLVNALYSEENAGLRNAAQEALMRVAPGNTRQLVDAVMSAPTDVQILLAPVLGESGSIGAVEALSELSRSSDANIATSAIVGLGRARSREAVAPLLEIIASNESWLVFPTVEALGVLGDPSAVDPLATHLDDALMNALVLRALVDIGDPRAARAIAAKLFSGTPLRADMLEGLVRMSQGDWPPVLTQAIRAGVIAAFREFYTPERFEELVELARVNEARSEAALEALGWTSDARALPVLLVALDRPSSQVSAGAGLSALFEDPAIVAQLPGYTDHLASPARLELARVLAAHQPVEAFRQVMVVLADGDDDFWRDAIDIASEALVYLTGSAATPNAQTADLVEQIVDRLEAAPAESRAVMTRLAVHLSRTGNTDYTRFLSRVEMLLGSRDLDVRLAAVELLAAWRGFSSELKAVLDAALADGDSFGRLRAVEIASELSHASLHGLFLRAVSDEDPLVRRTGVLALRAFSDSASTEALRARLVDWHGMVAADALTALAVRPGGLSEASLLGASRSDRALLRCVAVEFLASATTQTASSRVLEMAATDPDFEVRRAAVSAIRPHRDENTRKAVEIALGDMHQAVRHAGLRLAAMIGDPLLVEQISAVADTDESADVRGEALIALASTDSDAAFARIGRAMLDPRIAPYAVRALGIVAERDPKGLREYRDSKAPPRAAFAIDALYTNHIA